MPEGGSRSAGSRSAVVWDGSPVERRTGPRADRGAGRDFVRPPPATAPGTRLTRPAQRPGGPALRSRRINRGSPQARVATDGIARRAPSGPRPTRTKKCTQRCGKTPRLWHAWLREQFRQRANAYGTRVLVVDRRPLTYRAEVDLVQPCLGRRREQRRGRSLEDI
jgi:hypothetical protein